MAGFSVEIPEGRHISRPEGEFVEMEHGQHFQLYLRNSHTFQCECTVKTDGEERGNVRMIVFMSV